MHDCFCLDRLVHLTTETIQVAIHPNSRTADVYVAQLECRETGAVRTEEIRPDAPIVLGGLDLDYSYTVTAYAYNRHGAVIGSSPPERVHRDLGVPPPPPTPRATLTVNIVNLDPQNFPFIFTAFDCGFRLLRLPAPGRYEPGWGH